MTLRVLPPGGGGGDGEGPDDPTRSPELRVAMQVKLYELAERIHNPKHRRFAEAFVRDGDAYQAMLEADPAAIDLTERAMASRILAWMQDDDIAAYISAGKCTGTMMQAAIHYGSLLQQMLILASDPKTPAYVKGPLLLGLAKEVRESGIAALQGFAPPGKSDKRGSGAVPREAADEWLDLLSSSPPVPKKLGGGETG